MPIKVVVTDLDGTLLAPDHRVSPYTITTVKRLKEVGVCFVVATGRPYADVFATIRKCGLEPDYIITSNGSRIHDGHTHEALICHNIDAAAVCTLFQITGTPHSDGTIDGTCPEKQFVMNVNREGDWLTDKCHEDIRQAFDESLDYREVDPLTLTPADLEGTHGMWLSGKRDVLEKVSAYLQKDLSDTIWSIFSLPHILDCFPPGVNKGEALKEVAGLLGVSLADIACFGDGMNDESMLKYAGRPFIMSNGAAQLKAAVPHAEIIGSNEEDGVAKTLERLFFSSSITDGGS